MNGEGPGDHLEELPSRAFLATLAVVAALTVLASAVRLASSRSDLPWVVALGLGVITLVALGVAWEERRAHVHALVREAIEEMPAGADPVAELMRMGAHREAEYLRTRHDHPSTERA